MDKYCEIRDQPKEDKKIVGLEFKNINGFNVTIVSGDIDWTIEEKANDYVERTFILV